MVNIISKLKLKSVYKSIRGYCRIKPWIILTLFKLKKINLKLLSLITYDDLIYLSERILKQQDYEKLMLEIVGLQMDHLRVKKEKKKLKVAFLVDCSSVWAFDAVYTALSNHVSYEPYIVIPLYRTCDKLMKQDVICYFKRKKMKYYIVKERKGARWGNKMPDIIISQTPYVMAYWQKHFCPENLPCSCMTIFVPYSFWIMKKMDLGFIHRGYMKKFGIIFAPSKVHMNFFQEEIGINRSRLFYSGYPKCDIYYMNQKKKELNKVWKEKKRKAHIIYAPGVVDAFPSFSTFSLNYMEMLELAKDTQDTVSWVLRLHPTMSFSCIQQGVFADISEWDEYIKKWKELPNVMISINGDYSDIFKTSDGMVTDAVSFLPCYQYVHKPLLFLTRNTQKMNRLGNMMKEVVYTAGAKDINRIKTFINQTIIHGCDEYESKREEFFQKNLDYCSENGKLASEYIMDTINNLTSGGKLDDIYKEKN